MKVKDLFYIYTGSKLDFKKQTPDPNGINFVSRNSNFNGVVGRVLVNENTKIYKKGDITVPLGGSYLLSCFVQDEDFVTAQNVNVLRPKKKMSDIEKWFYCYALRLNRFRFVAFGREVNKYLAEIELPDEIPDWVYEKNVDAITTANKNPLPLSSVSTWDDFRVGDIFPPKKVKKYSKIPDSIGETPFISSTSMNNGVSTYCCEEPLDGNCITVSTNGDGFDVFYHEEPIVASNDVEVLYSNKLNKYNALFICTILRLEKFRWAYGRKAKNNKVYNTIIKLPSKDKQPDWEYMENYIKSLPYGDRL